MVEDWIPVETKLPDRKIGFVLIVIDFGYKCLPPAVRLGYYDDIDGHWRTQIGRIEKHWTVTHWMRLPDLPQS